MNQEQYAALTSREKFCTPVSVSQLENQTPRTLLYGYTCDRNTWHVYLENDHIHCLLYKGNVAISHTAGHSGGVADNQGYIPNKRLYPEHCDYEFCKLLMAADCSLPFTTFSEEKEMSGSYAGTLFDPDQMQKAVFVPPPKVDYPILAKAIQTQAAHEVGATLVQESDRMYTSADKADVLQDAIEDICEEVTVRPSRVDLFAEALRHPDEYVLDVLQETRVLPFSAMTTSIQSAFFSGGIADAVVLVENFETQIQQVTARVSTDTVANLEVIRIRNDEGLNLVLTKCPNRDIYLVLMQMFGSPETFDRRVARRLALLSPAN